MSSAASIAALIDHTSLKAEAARGDIIRLCNEAREHAFASVCVNGCWVPLATKELSGSNVKVCTVVGFPLGAMATAAKREESRIALEQGASELDMVMNVGRLLSEEFDAVREDVAAVVKTARANGALVKVILETCLLSDEQKVTACRLAMEAGADFVKTSTGFGSAGATEADVRLMRATVGSVLGVKASGGIRTLEQLRAMVAAGATRIGASASVAIMRAAG